jgi:hypothetical protein
MHFHLTHTLIGRENTRNSKSLHPDLTRPPCAGMGGRLRPEYPAFFGGIRSSHNDPCVMFERPLEAPFQGDGGLTETLSRLGLCGSGIQTKLRGVRVRGRRSKPFDRGSSIRRPGCVDGGSPKLNSRFGRPPNKRTVQRKLQYGNDAYIKHAIPRAVHVHSHSAQRHQ